MAHGAPTCPSCGSPNLEPGVLAPGGFMPKNRRLLALAPMGVSATACADCGHLWLSVDPAKLAKLLPAPRPAREIADLVTGYFVEPGCAGATFDADVPPPLRPTP
jgi:hypothetical protein